MGWRGDIDAQELRGLSRAQIQTRRDALFDEIAAYRQEYQRHVSEGEVIREQQRLAAEKRERLTQRLFEGTAKQRAAVPGQLVRLQAEEDRLGPAAEANAAARAAAEGALRTAQRQAHAADAHLARTDPGSGIAQRRPHRSAQSLFAAPARVADRMAGGHAALLLGLIGVIVVLYIALVPATPHTKDSRLILAERALAGQVTLN